MGWAHPRHVTTPIIYATLTYLCLLQETRCIGAALLAAHVCKDACCPHASWPMWMEPVALAIAACLASSPCATVRCVGCIMFAGHCRQILMRDDKYYSVDLAIGESWRLTSGHTP